MTQVDPFKSMATALDSPAPDFYLITPSNSDQLPVRPRAIRVGIAGDVMATGPGGEDVLFANCYAGELLPIRPVQIKATGTTASKLVALL